MLTPPQIEFIGIEDTFVEAMTLLWTKLFLLLAIFYMVKADEKSRKGTEFGCFNSSHKMNLNKDLKINATSVLKCRHTIQVPICWGRCDTWDIPDFQWNHSVCSYGRKTLKKVKLLDCDPNHPDPFMYLYVADTCECKLCKGIGCNYLHT
ncbi:unnamed protein product [Dimorphilus gyrociliatus]|uniref:Glycoprotein hormone subunit beta domain-containing protein n=1 Tax=Dimorphilus gyrociliatus TaxID=2664684 RepID=A0A7I8WCF9_9ANNE|nr:unnamed protein product [Dimorphilus gyrociliatus]